MSVLNRIAYYQNRRDEVPNKDDFVTTIAARMPLMTPSQATRLNKVIRQAKVR